MSFDEFWENWRWGAAVIAAVCAYFCALALTGAWSTFGVFHLEPYFFDLVAILASGQAHVAGIDVYGPNPFDPFQREHVYGPWWLATGSLGLTTLDAWWIGMLLTLTFLVVAVAVVRPRNWLDASFLFLVLASPPVFLAIERGNNDLVMFLLLALAARFVAEPRRTGLWAGAAAIVSAAALKFYPLAALPTLLASREKFRSRMLIAVTAVATFVLIWCLQHDSFQRALAVSPKPMTLFTVGLPLAPLTWRVLDEFHLWIVLGGGIGLLFSGIALGRLRHALWNLLPAAGWKTAAAVAGGSCWLFCYLAAINFPYRVALLILLLPAAREALGPVERRWGAIVLLVTIWLPWPKWIFAIGAAKASKAGTAWLCANSAMEQACFFTLSVAIAVVLMGWFVRQLKTATA